MKIQVDRNEQPTDVHRLVVYVGDNRYILTETNQGRLLINKSYVGEGDGSDNVCIWPWPRVGNEIEIL